MSESDDVAVKMRRPGRYHFYIALLFILGGCVASFFFMPQGIPYSPAGFLFVSSLHVIGCIGLLNALSARHQPQPERLLSLAFLCLSAGYVVLHALDLHLRGFTDR